MFYIFRIYKHNPTSTQYVCKVENEDIANEIVDNLNYVNLENDTVIFVKVKG